MTADANHLPFEPKAHAEELAHVMGWAFGFDPKDAPGWWDKAGHHNVRVLIQGRRLVGGLLQLPMGQYFGGRAVPTVGIAGVAVDSCARGRGVAREMMGATLRELNQRGVALSTLYASTHHLYRRLGYAEAGARYAFRVPGAVPVLMERGLSLRPIEAPDLRRVEDCYRARARHSNGFLDRSDYVWGRVRHPRLLEPRGVLVEGDAGIEGYLYAAHVPDPARAPLTRVQLTDLIALTARAGRQLLTYAADHRSLATEVQWHGELADPVLGAFDEARYLEPSVTDYWMLRLVHVGQALSSRGYQPHVAGELHCEVSDDVVPGNNRRFVLEVADGAGVVRAGGRAEIKGDVRGFAALYSGFQTGWALNTMGLLQGSERALATATALFGGPAPAMPDIF